MKLIDLLVRALPSLGGWPGGAACVQDDTCQLWFFHNGLPEYENGVWCADTSTNSFDWTRWGIFLDKKASDNHKAFVCKEEYEAALAASQQPAWSGEGLPPVGCECEVKRAIDWMRCKILFISEAHVVLLGEEECCWQTQSCCFRPIRTEEERKRDEAIADMRSSLGHAAGLIEVANIYLAIADGRIRGVKLEDAK